MRNGRNSNACARKKQPKDAYAIRTALEPLAFLSPLLIGLIVFTVYPFLNVFLISFKENYKISGAFSSFGLQNYQDVIRDPNFLNGLKNTGLYVLFVVPIATVLSLLIADALNKDIKLKGLFQTCYFLPMVTSITAIGLVWKWLFNNDYGLINYLISLFGISPVNWLNDPKYNLTALIIYGVWSMLPLTIILLLAGLQNVNPQYYVVARADGAKSGRIFFRITLPLLAPTIGLTSIINMIYASKVFTELFPLFNGKPGSAYSLYTVVYYLYDAFYVQWKLGRAAASAVILFFIVLILTLLQLRIQRKWKNY